MSQRIFIVEDEADMADMLSHHLRVAGYSVESAASGRIALEMIRLQLPDLIVLDLMLPELSGLDLCRALRGDQKTRHIAIIILSARAEEIDRVLGFELGADDYVVKPFSPREFALRIRAVLRRQITREITDLMKVGDLVVDRSRHEVW
ncbi:MAG: response regulator, partial [Verrucomicrobia bacterium]|nr:response regulator [Verrucomicrobiota bacterium]